MGRERKLDELKGLLDRGRLLTLTGRPVLGYLRRLSGSARALVTADAG